jgi:outer membrane biogenesis lipoprotein LolB
MSERDRALQVVRERYGGTLEKGAGQRFGPTLASEQLEEDEGIVIPVSTLRRWMRRRSSGLGDGSIGRNSRGEIGASILVSSFSSMAAFTTGSREEAPMAA